MDKERKPTVDIAEVRRPEAEGVCSSAITRCLRIGNTGVLRAVLEKSTRSRRIENDDQANPSANMSLCAPSALAALRDELLALIEDLRKRTPMERLIAIAQETEKDRWGIEALLARLDPKPMSK
ncbi:hypothetical protein [Rhodobacter maris]|nr:hypothetical protein [Rhodobacter maris]